MTAGKRYRLGLLVRSGPFSGRSARDQLDFALAAAALDFELELYFLGPGILQLLAEHQPEEAALPRGSKGWRSLPDLAEVRAFAPPEAMAGLAADQGLLLDVSPLDGVGMAARWRACDQVLVI